MFVGRGRAADRRLDRHLDDDAVRAEDDVLGRVGRAAGNYAQRTPVEHVLGPQQHAECSVPAQ
jgi:hypothetical protein